MIKCKMKNKRIEYRIDEILDQYAYADESTRPWIIGFSGGKDSTVLLMLVWIALEKLKELPGPFQLRRPIYVVCNDTMVENPIIASYVDQVLEQIEKKAREDNFWDNIEVGEIVEGKVVRFASFGAFVNVRGFDCLAHISDLSWSSIKDPSEVLELNKTYEFVVLKLDREANRVSIGYKQLIPDPWQVAYEKYPVGSVIKGKVARILPFGAFVEIEPGIDGLLHVSNVSWEWVDDIKKVLNIGDEIEVVVTEFNPETKRITLSRKATMEQPANLERHHAE